MDEVDSPMSSSGPAQNLVTEGKDLHGTTTHLIEADDVRADSAAVAPVSGDLAEGGPVDGEEEGYDGVSDHGDDQVVPRARLPLEPRTLSSRVRRPGRTHTDDAFVDITAWSGSRGRTATSAAIGKRKSEPEPAAATGTDISSADSAGTPYVVCGRVFLQFRLTSN
jgi:hypothetical protein